MSTAARLGAFGALLAIVFGIATVAGGAADPKRKPAAREEGHGDGMTGDEATGNGDTLLLAAAQQTRRAVVKIVELDQVQRVPYAFLYRALG